MLIRLIAIKPGYLPSSWKLSNSPSICTIYLATKQTISLFSLTGARRVAHVNYLLLSLPSLREIVIGMIAISHVGTLGA